MKKISNSLLALTTSAIVAFIVLSAITFWQRERTMPQVQPLSPSPSQGRPEPTPLPAPTPTVQPSSGSTANWKVYRNKQYGFEVKYPPYLSNNTTLCGQPSKISGEASLISFFCYRRSDKIVRWFEELLVYASKRPLDGYIVQNLPAGFSFRFDQKENRWIWTTRDEITGLEPKLLDALTTAYAFKSGDGIGNWHHAIVPHLKGRYVLELIFIRGVDECPADPKLMEVCVQQRPPLGAPDITGIVNTIRFID